MLSKIYTSYYGNMDKIEKQGNLLPISISGKPPEWFKYPQFKILAPSWSIWKEWHDRTDSERDKDYTKRFLNERIAYLKSSDVLLAIEKIVLENAKDKDNLPIPVLMCYEAPGKFCHRHIVSKWLKIENPELEIGELSNENKGSRSNTEGN